MGLIDFDIFQSIIQSLFNVTPAEAGIMIFLAILVTIFIGLTLHEVGILGESIIILVIFAFATTMGYIDVWIFVILIIIIAIAFASGLVKKVFGKE